MTYVYVFCNSWFKDKNAPKKILNNAAMLEKKQNNKLKKEFDKFMQPVRSSFSPNLTSVFVRNPTQTSEAEVSEVKLINEPNVQGKTGTSENEEGKKILPNIGR